MIPFVALLIIVFVVTGCGSSSAGTTQPTATTPSVITTAATSPAPTLASTTPATAKPTSTSAPATAPATSTSSATNTATQTYGGNLRIIQPSSPASPIGWIGETAGEALRNAQLSIELLLRGQVDGSMLPGLATAYKVDTNPSSPSITFTLRKGVKFHDGTDFNAQAVKWNLEQTKAGPAMVMSGAYWKSFDIIDDYTIRVNLTAWQNRNLQGFAMGSGSIISPTAYQKNGIDWMRWHMVGTGPFIQKDFQQDVTLKTTKFDGYWDKGKPYLDGVQYLYVADEMTRLALFKSGGADALDLSGNGRLANDLKASGYQIISKLGGTNALIPDSMNADSPWSNAKVRQAAEYALDKDALNKAFGYGYTEAAYQLPSPSNSSYDPNFTGARKYDVAKAKQLLTDAGYPNGFKTRLIASSNARDIVTAMQSYLQKVGIQADLEFPEPAKLNSYTQSGVGWNNGLIYQYISEYPNYNYSLNLWFGVPTSWFPSLKKPDGWKDALMASMVTENPDNTMIRKLVKTMYDDATIITVNYPAQMLATTSQVHDTGMLSRIAYYYWNPQDAWLSK